MFTEEARKPLHQFVSPIPSTRAFSSGPACGTGGGPFWSDLMGKLPAFQFYPGDWMKDPSLRACSLQARGLWIDMLCLMHESSRRGYLQHCTSNPVTAAQLARMTGCATDEADALLRELMNAGVCSRTDNEVIYSRRMVRDESKREKCVEAGKKGGNPTLIRGSKGVSKGQSNPKPTPSSSSSSSSSDFALSVDAGARRRNPPPGSEPIPQGFHAFAEDYMRRVLTGSRGLTPNDKRTIAEWTIRVEKLPPTEVRGRVFTGPEIALLCLDLAEQAGVNAGVGPILAYVDSIMDRCARQKCLPGEFVAAKPTGMKIVQQPRDYAKIVEGLGT